MDPSELRRFSESSIGGTVSTPIAFRLERDAGVLALKGTAQDGRVAGRYAVSRKLVKKVARVSCVATYTCPGSVTRERIRQIEAKALREAEASEPVAKDAKLLGLIGNSVGLDWVAGDSACSTW